MVAWFAGLFYIFRLFVYHRKYCEEPKLCEVYRIMEGKLLKIIMIPASILTLIFGLLMIGMQPGFLSQGWLWIKLAGVLGLYIYQWFSYQTYQRFSKKDFFLTERQCRMINEIPTLALFLIVIMVVIKPF